MNYQRDNSTNGFAGNNSHSFLGYGQSQNFDYNITQQHQQHQYAHRASAPDALGLSRMHPLTSDVSQISPEQLIKPLQQQPWNGQLRLESQVQRFPPVPWQNDMVQFSRTVMTEPNLNNQNMMMRRSVSRGGSDGVDSGYFSQAPTSGAHFSDPCSGNRKDLEQDFLTDHGKKFDIRRGDGYRPPATQSVVSDNVSSGRVSRKAPVSKCPVCERPARNASDARKHALTHERPYRCMEPGCTRKEGFATINDRERHRKSVHSLRPAVGNTSGYICFACAQNGSKENKFWPRRDNFKAHIKRKHKDDWDEAHLLECSKAQRPDDAMSIYDQSQYISHSRNPSQVGEGVGYQNRMLNNSPSTMSRHPSQQDDFGNGLFQSGVEMHEDPFTGIGSHASVMSTHQEQYEQTFLTSGDEMGLHALGQAASIQKTPAPSYLHPSSAQQPLTKKRRLSSTSNYPDNYGTAQPSNNTFVPSPTTEREEPFQPKLPPDTTAPPNEYKCPECDKIKKRECDLKKHMKRHTRPYGCTFANCSKKFGSRNDWKRHETGQHYLPEMWKCGRARAAELGGGICFRRPLHTHDQMLRHLKGPEHRMAPPPSTEIEAEANRYHLGPEGHVNFWCGFCKKLIPQPPDAPNASENRFKHIGDHFDHDKFVIDDWVCIEENKAKRYITQEEKKASRRRARDGYRVENWRGEGVGEEEEEELEDWSPDLTTHGFVADHRGFGHMRISSCSSQMDVVGEERDAECVSDGENFVGIR